ncbi:hypothetical protein E2C01_035528 [Portunus trituberculatus]|uniref:Uncharacterized protein n=1 Tax=Portunus trituberculatus TaxID=210409 RepID=A0A5B7F9Z9_PORTR|nr:hypothetical protein [Portunus trituberculatus]
MKLLQQIMCITLKKNWINGDKEMRHYEPHSNHIKIKNKKN